MNILYTAPRYHTNQVPIMKGWYESKNKVMFLAEFEGVSEIHDYVDFRIMKPGILSKFIFKRIEGKYGPNEVEGKKIKYFFPAFWDIVKTIKTFRPDLVIMRERYISTLIIYAVCRMLGISKCILYVQQPIYGTDEGGNRIKKWLKQILFPKAVFSPVLYHGKQRGKIGKSDIYYVPLIAENNNPEEILKRSYFKDKKINFLDIGKYRNYKNHFFLIDAFEQLQKKDRLGSVQLTIIGQLSNYEEEEYYKKLKEYVKNKKLENVIEIRPNIPFREMESLYLDYDVLLLPSTYESAGMVILEAMEKGLCVVTSIYCGLGSYLEEYECGFTFNLDNTESLVEIIENLTDNRNTIISMGQKSIEVINHKLSFLNYYHHLSEVTYKEFGYSLELLE